MTKTQVQIPDHLYEEAKRIARDYEMSLAEVFRSPRRDLLLESCPTRLFLPSPGARSDQTSELYQRIGLSRREVEIIAATVALLFWKKDPGAL